MTPEEFHQHQIAEFNRGRKPSKPMPLLETKDSKRIKELEKVMRAEAALILRERFSIEDEAQVERLRLSACRLVDAVK